MVNKPFLLVIVLCFIGIVQSEQATQPRAEVQSNSLFGSNPTCYQEYQFCCQILNQAPQVKQKFQDALGWAFERQVPTVQEQAVWRQFIKDLKADNSVSPAFKNIVASFLGEVDNKKKRLLLKILVTAGIFSVIGLAGGTALYLNRSDSSKKSKKSDSLEKSKTLKNAQDERLPVLATPDLVLPVEQTISSNLRKEGPVVIRMPSAPKESDFVAQYRGNKSSLSYTLIESHLSSISALQQKFFDWQKLFEVACEKNDISIVTSLIEVYAVNGFQSKKPFIDACVKAFNEKNSLLLECLFRVLPISDLADAQTVFAALKNNDFEQAKLLLRALVATNCASIKQLIINLDKTDLLTPPVLSVVFGELDRDKNDELNSALLRTLSKKINSHQDIEYLMSYIRPEDLNRSDWFSHDNKDLETPFISAVISNNLPLVARLLGISGNDPKMLNQSCNQIGQQSCALAIAVANYIKTGNGGVYFHLLNIKNARSDYDRAIIFIEKDHPSRGDLRDELVSALNRFYPNTILSSDTPLRLASTRHAVVDIQNSLNDQKRLRESEINDIETEIKNLLSSSDDKAMTQAHLATLRERLAALKSRV